MRIPNVRYVYIFRLHRKHRKHVCTSCTPSNTPFNSSGHREIPPRHSSHVTSRHVTSHQPSAAVSASASSPERSDSVSVCFVPYAIFHRFYFFNLYCRTHTLTRSLAPLTRAHNMLWSEYTHICTHILVHTFDGVVVGVVARAFVAPLDVVVFHSSAKNVRMARSPLVQ